MAKTKRRKNLFGFGGKRKHLATAPGKCAKKSSLTIGPAIRKAYAAGRESGDTGGFDGFLCRTGLQDRSATLKRRLFQEYERGVLSLSDKSTTAVPARPAGGSGKKSKAGKYSGVGEKTARLYDEIAAGMGSKSYKAASPESKRAIERVAADMKAKGVNPKGKSRPVEYYIEVKDGKKWQDSGEAFDTRAKAATFAKLEVGVPYRIKARKAKANPNQGEYVGIRRVLEQRYGVSPLAAPPEAILWAADHYAKSASYEHARKELSALNRRREAAGKIPAVPAYGTKLFKKNPSRSRSHAQRQHRQSASKKRFFERHIPSMSSPEAMRPSRKYTPPGAKKAGNPVGPLATVKQGKGTAKVYRKLRGYEVRVQPGGAKLLGEDKEQKFPARSFKGAMTIGRVALASVARNGKVTSDDFLDFIPGFNALDKLTKKTFPAKRFKGRKTARNPIDAAEKMYEEFHGSPSKEILEYIEDEHRHKVTANVGTLVYIQVQDQFGELHTLGAPGYSCTGTSAADVDRKPEKFQWPEVKTPADQIVLLTTSEDGRQLFFVGGDQAVDPAAVGLTKADQHDHMFLGFIVSIMYDTHKTFENKGEQTQFYHHFGNEGSGGVLPMLMYHPIDKRMKVYGGRYKIAPPERSLGNVSPGIVG